jgi:Dockerin type I domain
MTNDGDINTRRDGEEPQVPPRLIAALKEPSARRVFVPPAIDQAVLRAAHRQLEKTPAPRRSLFRAWFVWPAMAAACLVLIGLIHFITRPNSRTTGFAREDINHDGQVDILDAFQLARELQSGAKSTADLNGDGVVDQRDADLIAARAVRLEKGGRS